MRDLALDPATGDLALSAGAARLTSGVEAKAQRLRLRLSLRRGEYILDRRAGLPYLTQILGKGTASTAEVLLRRAVATSPGLSAIEHWEFAIGPDRVASLSLRARTIEGEPVELDAFTLEGSS